MALTIDIICFIIDLVFEWSTKFFSTALPAIADWHDLRVLNYVWGRGEKRLLFSKRRRGWVYFFPANDLSDFFLYKAEIMNRRYYRRTWFNSGLKLLPSEVFGFCGSLAKDDVYIYDSDVSYGMSAKEKSLKYADFTNE